MQFSWVAEVQSGKNLEALAAGCSTTSSRGLAPAPVRPKDAMDSAIAITESFFMKFPVFCLANNFSQSNTALLIAQE